MGKGAWRIADGFMIALVALIIGSLFTWWTGCIVFMVGLVLIVRPRIRDASLQLMTSEDPKSAEELLEWHQWEVTHGPSASGIANPSQRDN